MDDIVSRQGQKYKMCGLMALILLPFYMMAQVQVGARINTASNEKVYVALYSEKDEQLHPVFDKKIELDVLQYEEYIIVFFQKNTIPLFYSIGTNANSPTLNITANLQQGKVQADSYIPSYRIDKSGNSKFDLDRLEDKAAFGFQMGKAAADMEVFYKNGQLPRIKSIRKTNINLEAIRKTEHKLGQELYVLLQKKQWLEKHLSGIAHLIKPSADINSEQFCINELKYLKIETQLIQTEYKMAMKELERVKLRNNKAIKTGNAPSKKALKNAVSKAASIEKEANIAELNLKNKQADCWALRKQKKLERTKGIAEKEKQIQQLAISNIRLKQRQDNAIQLYKKHNSLASTLTGRARVESLANAQKHAFDQAIVKVYQSQNNLKKWQLKDQGTGKFNNDIKRANALLSKRREMAWQAEMSYLEHMWHLRDKSTFGERASEDLFNRQSGLLRIAPPPQWALPAPDASDEEILAKAAIVEEIDNGTEKIKKIKFQDDYYEIVINTERVKRYTKNNKPITSITYRFETVKKFGEYLNNIRVEESRKSWLMDLFKKRIF